MRAATYAERGPARQVLRIVEIPTPLPGPGEVRVRLHTSGVNPADVKGRMTAALHALPFPFVVPHSDGAGVIDAVGADVPDSRVGERVWVFNAQFQRAFGTAAEYVCLPSGMAVSLPDSVDFAVGACLGIPFRTAYSAVELGGDLDGKSVLVTGGAGAVGHYAVQIAKIRGAKVIATVSSREKAEHARSGGADVVLLYPEGKIVEQVLEATAGQGVDHVVEVDLTTNAAMLPELLRPGGSVAVYGSRDGTATVPATPLRVRGATLHFFQVYRASPSLQSKIIGEFEELSARGGITHTIAERFPLEKIVEAHEAVESGKVIGNVVIDIG